MKVVLENIRSFVGRKEIELKPLTLLTGENSAGKSTFLSVLSMVLKQPSYPFFTDFNETPFELGSFDTIATNKGSGSRKAKAFTIGIISDQDQELSTTYVSRSGQPVLHRITARHATDEAQIELPTEDSERLSIRLQLNGDGTPFSFSSELPLTRRSISDWRNLGTSFLAYLVFAEIQKNNKRPEDQDRLAQLLSGAQGRTAISVAPIRTKPKRTYDQFTDVYNAEGAHIPYVLARFFDKEYSGKDGDKIKSTIDAFGKESGLYKKIKVKKLGEMITDPFQVNATIFSKATNLLDVGYGVSQALPVVVQSILMNSRNILLLQQPEVHLHPRAQAALGTFFCGLVSTSERQFVIETHSDYIIDRVRQEVARGNIDKEKVLILFLHKTRNETQVFPLSLDELGNVRNAPSSYREFFIQEDINLLSRSR